MNDYTSWFVGMKVACVDAAPAWDGSSMLKKGNVYTIAGIFDTPTGVGVTLEEMAPRDDYLGWHCERFRPVQTRKTDIAIFQRLLDNPRVRITEDA